MTKPMSITPDTFASLHLAEEADRMLDGLRGASSGHAAKTLVKDGAFKLVLVALRAGATLAEHAAPGPALVLPVVGTALLRQGAEMRVLSAPAADAALMGSGLRHSVEATTDCAVLLVIG